MGKCKRVLRCYHCGAILQCTNPNEKGYILPESLNRATPIQIIYCDNCFETMKAFNNSQLSQNVDQEILKILYVNIRLLYYEKLQKRRLFIFLNPYSKDNTCHRKNKSNNPKTSHYFYFTPSKFLKMMMNWGHQKDSLMKGLIPKYLNNY